MNPFSVLRDCAVLSDLPLDAIERLSAVASFRDFTDGEVILRHGHEVDHLGIVVTGEVEARYRTERADHPAEGSMGRIREGEVFGEMSLLTGEPATADVIASTTTRVCMVPHVSLTREIARYPAASTRLARLLVKRLTAREADPAEQDAEAGARREARIRGPYDPPLGGRPVLVLNAGSSSLKYALFAGGDRKAMGLVEKVGVEGMRLKHDGPAGRLEKPLEQGDHRVALAQVLDLLTDRTHGPLERLGDLAAIGHRVVHGGDRFSESIVIDAPVQDEIRKCIPLAPLHNPANLLGVEACDQLLPGVPQVAVFDTAFHHTLPEHAWRYAIPRDLADKERLRRYGFHGTSHKYIARATGSYLGTSSRELRIVSCHLGNGASVCAIDHGRSIDTSMGLTPLEGIVMGTRSGDLDPGLLLYLLGQGRTREELDGILNKKSGLLGVSGYAGDMRELETAADAGHAGALLAIQVFCYRIRKYVGAYAAAMGGLDVLAFTGGIGQNAAGVRSRVCQGLGFLGIVLDEARNRGRLEAGALALTVSTDTSPVKVLVVPTDEEAMIAVETDHALKRAGVTEVMRARRDRPVPIGVSAHHVHLCQAHVEALWGPGHTLTFRAPLYQEGEFACQETVDLVGPKGRVDRVRVLGPARPQTQVEISRTEEFKLGIDAPIRNSGDLAGSPGLTLVGSAGEVKLTQGVICARRHIHMCPADALGFGLRDGDEVRVEVTGNGRSILFGDVSIRVKPTYKLEMHIDTDEANAAEVSAGATGRIDSIQHRRS